jgi:hypothetical protein
VAAYIGNNHACLRHKRFTDNDRDQQTYGSDQSGAEKITEMTGNGHKFVFPNVKTINAAVKTHTRGVPEKITINLHLQQETVIKTNNNLPLYCFSGDLVPRHDLVHTDATPSKGDNSNTYSFLL